jgi:peptide/nickel transport system substrate-binding protein
MKLKRTSMVVAAVAAVTTALSGCATGASDVVAGSTISVGWNQAFYSANSSTSNGNATANNNILYLANSGFNYYDSEPKLVKNEQFGTYEKVSDSPLTIKYTVNSGVTWSDGAAVDASDMMLAWAANSCNFNNVEPTYDETTGEITNQAELDAGVFFDSAACGGDLSQITETPTIGDDGRSLTIVYDKPVVDWELNFGIGVSAHVTVQQAFKDEELSASDAKTRLLDAVAAKDVAVLAPIATAWSTAYDFMDMPEDTSLLVSNGAYVVTDLVKDQYVTLTAREGYTWGPSPKIEKITVRIIADPLASVTALANGEVDIISPQATADIITALSADDVVSKGITFDTTSDSTYEHIDLTFNNKGPFDPATYGGDEAKALAVRKAFLKTIPRTDIVDKLIKPINATAEVVNSQTTLPGAAGYEDISSANGSADYADVDIEGAKALLAEAGVSNVDVNWLYGCSNTRRANSFALIQESAKKAGFNVINKCDENWGSLLGSGTYDAVEFAWQMTSLGVSGSISTFQTGNGNNLNGYSNAKVDAAYDSIQTELDAQKQIALKLDAEKELWADAYGITIFQFPGVTSWNTSKVEGVVPAPLAPMFFWNFWEWTAKGNAVQG